MEELRKKSAGKSNHALKDQDVGRREKEAMKIAVTYEDGSVFQHFGHTEQFKVYEVTDGKIVDAQIVSTEGSGHGALAGMLGTEGGCADLRRRWRGRTGGAGRSRD